MLKHAVTFVKVNGKHVCMRTDKLDELKKKNKGNWKKNLKSVAKLIEAFGEEKLTELVAIANIKEPFEKVARKVAGGKKWKGLNEKQRHILTEILYTMALDRNGGSVDEETETVDSEQVPPQGENAPSMEFEDNPEEAENAYKTFSASGMTENEAYYMYNHIILTITEINRKYDPVFEEFALPLFDEHRHLLYTYIEYGLGVGKKPVGLKITDPELFSEFRALFRIMWVRDTMDKALEKVKDKAVA